MNLAQILKLKTFIFCYRPFLDITGTVKMNFFIAAQSQAQSQAIKDVKFTPQMTCKVTVIKKIRPFPKNLRRNRAMAEWHNKGKWDPFHGGS